MTSEWHEEKSQYTGHPPPGFPAIPCHSNRSQYPHSQALPPSFHNPTGRSYPGLETLEASLTKAPEWFVPMFEYDENEFGPRGRRFNNKYNPLRIPKFRENETPVENWMMATHSEIIANGKEAVCLLLPRHAFAEGSFMVRSFNALSLPDQCNLTIGRGTWRNWHFWIQNLQDNLDAQLRLKAQVRKKKPNEDFPAYLAETYPLFKAAYRHDPDREIIRCIKTGFHDWNALNSMPEESNFEVLLAQAHQYERIKQLWQETATTSTQPTSSYLHVESQKLTPPPNGIADPESFSFVSRSRPPFSRNKPLPLPDATHFVLSHALDARMAVGRRSVPDDQIDPRAKTVNFQNSTQHGKFMRSYIRINRDGQAKIVFMKHDCRTCEAEGVSPADHFVFEHNLYHLPKSNTHVHELGLPEIDDDDEEMFDAGNEHWC